MFRNLKTKQNRAFTLIESLVAVSIFTASILAMMGVLSNNLRDITYAKDKVTATYLAQEGLEYFRNMRDTFVLYQDANSNGWNDFLLKTADCEKTQSSPGCYFIDKMVATENESPITSDKMTIVACPSGTCPNLTYNTATGSYDYTGLVDSGFSRKINTVRINDHEIQVYVTVSFVYGGQVREVSFSENLFNWQ